MDPDQATLQAHSDNWVVSRVVLASPFSVGFACDVGTEPESVTETSTDLQPRLTP